MQLFVPGRLCLFGEHSDWAGSYRQINSHLEKGCTLIVGTNQGTYANVKTSTDKLIISSTLNDGRKKSKQISMNSKKLLEEAKKGSFFSYVAGVAYQACSNYKVSGLEIDNYKTDLPIQKGLSSSASICVLVARAFNRLYNLGLSLQEEMELAFQGENTTASRCGRMDQACAYGNQPVIMTFDGYKTSIAKIQVPTEIYFVIVDLGKRKNTLKILAELNECFPVPTNQTQKRVQNYLGPINFKITQDAANALKRGDAKTLGRLMNTAQAEFDKNLIPQCPSELSAPVLHSLLEYKPIQPYIWGGKGVGSQGDGSAQFIVKDGECQKTVTKIIERDFPSMKCLKLSVKP